MHDTTPYQRLFRINRLIWCSIATVALVDAAWLYYEGVTLDVSQALLFFPIVAAFFAISFIYRTLRKDARLCLLGDIANQLLLTAAVIGVLSYVSARANLPLRDAQMVAIDHMFHFDWRDYVAWVDSIPLLAKGLSYTYMSSGPQMILVMFLLFLYQHLAHAQRFILNFIAAAIIVVILSTLFPAMGAYVYFHFEPSQFRHIEPAAGYTHAKPLEDMRNHSVNTLTFPLKGLVTFPSFHSALSILLIAASRPIRWLFAMFLPLNLLILMSTPADGGHYLIDVLAGVAIGLGVIFATQRLITPPTEHA